MPVISGSQHSTQTKHSTILSKADVIANIQTCHQNNKSTPKFSTMKTNIDCVKPGFTSSSPNLPVNHLHSVATELFPIHRNICDRLISSSPYSKTFFITCSHTPCRLASCSSLHAVTALLLIYCLMQNHQ